VVVVGSSLAHLLLRAQQQSVVAAGCSCRRGSSSS
jgi:hypothetical protein